MEARTPFAYDDLASKSSMPQFRLLEIAPASSFVATISCTLRTHFLNNHPRYQALSYVGGVTTPSEEIFVNGFSCSVRRDLRNAIFRLRNADKPRLVWIDAICINQADELEKSLQITLMRYFYENASEVFVFLGDVHFDVGRDANTMAASGLRFVETLQRAAYHADLSKLTANDGKISTLAGNLKRLGLPEPGTPDYSEHGVLLARRWFTRVWILQEVISSSNVSVTFGNIYIPWTSFSDSLIFSQKIGIVPIFIRPQLTSAAERTTNFVYQSAKGYLLACASDKISPHKIGEIHQEIVLKLIEVMSKTLA